MCEAQPGKTTPRDLIAMLEKLFELRRPAAIRSGTRPIGLLLGALLILFFALAAQGRLARSASTVERVSERHARLAAIRSLLASSNIDKADGALARLTALDEPGALDLWQAALNQADPTVQREAWELFRTVRVGLARNQWVPRIARVGAQIDDLKRLATAWGFDITIWVEEGSQMVVALPPYLIDELRRQGVSVSVLYDSIYEWQQARGKGDKQADQITPDYLSAKAASRSAPHIAILELGNRRQPAPGYSDWLGDPENIVMQSRRFVAYLDSSAAGDSDEVLSAYVEERYSRRGYKVAAFCSPDKFAANARRFFPKRLIDSWTAGRMALSSQSLSDGYHSYESALDECRALAEAHPDLAQFVTLGTTYEGRLIFALKIAKDPQLTNTGKPAALFTGCHHAQEWISVEPPIYYAKQLLSSYADEDRVRYLVDHLEIWIVPIVNPDGLAYDRSFGSQSFPFWRKNRRPVSEDGCGPGVGVDLNRNYKFQWRLESDLPCPITSGDIGASDYADSAFYRGPAPESELEIKALDWLTDDPRLRLLARVDYHNFAEQILYPWSHQSEPTRDDQTLLDLARRMSAEMRATTGHGYAPLRAIDFYIATGSSIDYAYGVNKVPAAYGVELRGGPSFYLPPEQILPTCQENWAGSRLLLEWAVGAPILEAVSIYQDSSGLAEPVYAAHWTTDGDQRRLVQERVPTALEAGRLLVRLKFSKPMDATVAPIAQMARAASLDEVALVASGSGQGWQKTDYENDTWVGESVIAAWSGGDPYQLSVQASERAGLALDGKPETIAVYRVGTGGWQGYEGLTAAGGTDTTHLVGFEVGLGSLRVAIPNGGERLVPGTQVAISWSFPVDDKRAVIGFDVKLSTDGGANFAATIASGLPPAARSFAWSIPNVCAAHARIRVIAITAAASTVADESDGDFSIAQAGPGLNLGASSIEGGVLLLKTVPGGAFADSVVVEISTDEAGTALAGFSRMPKLKRGGLTLRTRGTIGGQDLDVFFPDGAVRVLRVTNSPCGLTESRVRRSGNQLQPVGS